MSDIVGGYERVRVLVETQERVFRGYLSKPKGTDGESRLSDFLNTRDKGFLCLSDVQITDRGQTYRVGERRDFVAIAVAQVTYVTPMTAEELASTRV